eukprot:scaffold11375_cov123-Isochrysis_galbana.AAC.5
MSPQLGVIVRLPSERARALCPDLFGAAAPRIVGGVAASRAPTACDDAMTPTHDSLVSIRLGF